MLTVGHKVHPESTIRPPLAREVATGFCYNSCLMLAVVAGSICGVIVFGAVWIVRSRRARAMDKVMRDYVRRAY